MCGYIWAWIDHFDDREHVSDSLGDIAGEVLRHYMNVFYDDVHVDEKGKTIIIKCRDKQYEIAKSIPAMIAFLEKLAEEFETHDEFEIYD